MSKKPQVNKCWLSSPIRNHHEQIVACKQLITTELTCSVERRLTAISTSYSSCHQIAYFKPMEGLQTHTHTHLPHGSKSPVHVVSFATLRVLNSLHSPGIRCSCCNGVRFCCDLEACNLVMATIAFCAC
jgi:hypothetical protein